MIDMLPPITAEQAHVRKLFNEEKTGWLKSIANHAPDTSNPPIWRHWTEQGGILRYNFSEEELLALAGTNLAVARILVDRRNTVLFGAMPEVQAATEGLIAGTSPATRQLRPAA